ncbi:MAG: cytochrome D ubiquinol oxidase subunit I [Rhodospirillaceae bacterium]|nr:MAG: cytochrome D ubiquinol oxidase subunit I [Rhodospirillaceae bacterium]
MVDDMIDYLASTRDRPVWQKMPDDIRSSFHEPLPQISNNPAEVYEDFRRRILPYAVGNTHPRFMGWVHGGGNVIGMLAELLAAGLNANLGGRDQAPIEVERQVIRWVAEMLGFPKDASGVLVTGTSLANLIGVVVARTHALGSHVRQDGLQAARLTAYTSRMAHGCIAKAMDVVGLGTEALRMIPCDASHRIDLPALAAAVARDRASGAMPFLVVGNAGTVDAGAVDDLAALAAFCRAQGLWFHVDGAFGAMAMLAPSLRPLLSGIELADSVGLDFHKWMQVPYDAGCIIVRDAATHLAAFAAPAHYLGREARGLAAGSPWPCDLGTDLSRGFRALKVWMTIQVYGTARLGEVVARSCALARELAARVDDEPALERLAPVAMNIVCFRYRAASVNLDRLNADIVADLQEMGIAAPSTTVIDGCVAIRAALFNHRTLPQDIHALVDAVLTRGRARTEEPGTAS